MSDPALLTFGCAITFLTIGGAYVALREQFLTGLSRRTFLVRRPQPARVETAAGRSRT